MIKNLGTSESQILSLRVVWLLSKKYSGSGDPEWWKIVREWDG